jgi:transcription factor SPN1
MDDPTQIQTGNLTQLQTDEEDEMDPLNTTTQSDLQTQQQTNTSVDEIDQDDEEEAAQKSSDEDGQTDAQSHDITQNDKNDDDENDNMAFDEEDEKKSNQEESKSEEVVDQEEEKKPKKKLKKNKAKKRKQRDEDEEDEDFKEDESEPPTPSDSPAKKRKTKRSSTSQKKKDVVEEDNPDTPLAGDEEDERVDINELDKHRRADESTSSRSKHEKTEFDFVLEEITPKRMTKDDQGAMDELSANLARDLCTKMAHAYEADVQANKNHKPATHKLILLPEVKKQATKIYMHSALVEADFLSILANWIAMLDDGSLPNMNIRTAVLQILTEIPVGGETARLQQRRDEFDGIQKEHLKDSRIAHHVKVLAEHPKETTENRRLANDLLQRWSRLVFGLSEDYRNLARYQEQEEQQEERRSKRLNKQHQVKEAESPKAKNPGEPGFKIRAQVPRIEGFDFKKRPENKISKSTVKVVPPPPSVSSSVNSFQSPTQRRMAKKLLDMKRNSSKKT